MTNILELRQEDLRILFEEGAFFILLDVPPGTELGVDMKTWNTAEKFKGIKMIPPGLHFIHYSSIDNCGEVGLRSGFYYNFKRKEVLVKKWDNKLEDISKDDVDVEEVTKIRENLKNLDKYLGCYPYEIYPRWIQLSNHINENVVKKLTPKCGTIRSAVDLVSCNDEDRPRGSVETKIESSSSKNKASPNGSRCRRNTKRNDIEKNDYLLPDLKPVDGTDIQFTKFPEKHYPEGSTPAQITEHSMDSSFLLQCMLKHHEKLLDFLGEVQFSFLCFLILTNLDAFEHWKELIGLLCSCDKAIIKHRMIYDNFTEMLEPQLSEIPPDFLVDIVSNNNFIFVKLKNLFRFVFESEIDGELKSKISRFRQRISAQYNWDLNDRTVESDEDLPVIVNLEND